MRESTVERYLVKQVAKVGGRAYKWVSPGNRGVPDRIVAFPDGSTVFVELKSPIGVLSKQQRTQILYLRDLGCHVCIIDSKEAVDRLVQVYVEV